MPVIPWRLLVALAPVGLFTILDMAIHKTSDWYMKRMLKKYGDTDA